jgi:hypothetical protein
MSEDEVSDMNSDEFDEEESKISKEAHKNFMTNEVREKIIAFIKLDDAIRKKNEELKELKDKKKPCEEQILRFLENIESGSDEGKHINVPGGKLIKNKSETKEALKIDVIKEAIIESMKKENLVTDDIRCKEILEGMIDLMDKKRPTKVRTNIKRTFERQKQPKKEGKKGGDKK